jgi:N-acetylglucosaminyl-diphospho-decaprenol L-rhamnosyltransferase
VTEPGDGPAPDVSVSIVNTSSCDLLLACLESLESDRDGPVSVEVTVLDNASVDGAAEAVRERVPWARVIALGQRAGFGANHNTVIRATRGRYIYVLNEDATVEPGSFERLVAYMDSHPEVGAAGPHIRYPDGRHQPSAWRFPSPAAAALGTLTLSRVGIEQSRGDKPRRVDWAMGCALLVRREALDRIGLFDESFFIYSEETDLCRRLADAGYETHFLPQVTVFHHVSQFSADVPERRINEEWRSRTRYWRKHHSPLAARGTALLTGLQYAARAVVGEVVLHLPEGRRPVRIDQAAPARLRLHARNAWAGVRGPGLREYAEEWNREHPEAGRPPDEAAGTTS